MRPRSVQDGAASPFVAATLSLALAACGARSNTGRIGDDDRLTAVDGGDLGQLVDVDDGTNVRENPEPSPSPQVRPGPDTPVDPSPTPGVPEPDDPSTQPMPEPADPVGPPSAPTTQPEPDGVAPPAPTATPPDVPIVPSPDEPAPDVEPPPPGSVTVVDPAAPRLWLYVDDGAGRLVNLRNTSESFAVPVVDLASNLLRPWSRDGRNLVHLADGAVVFTDLDTGAELARMDAGAQLTIHGWVDGYGALASYYYEGTPVLYLDNPAGEFVILGQTPEVALTQRASASPFGNGFTFASESEGSAHVYWVSLDDGVAAPVQILEAGLGALAEVAWAPDGRWGAFTDGPNGALYLFDTARPDQPVLLANSSAAAEFSPASDVLVTFDGTLLVAALDDIANVRSTVLSGPDVSSPARFSADGGFLTYRGRGNDGVVQRVEGGVPTDAYSFESFDSDCALVWTGATTFLYQQCSGADRGLAGVSIDGDTATTTVHNVDLLDGFAFGPGERCFVNFGGSRLDVGSRALPLVVEFTRSAVRDISLGALSPNDSAVVWVEGGTDLYWLPLNEDCTVSSLPILVSDASTIDALAFVAEWP